MLPLVVPLQCLWCFWCHWFARMPRRPHGLVAPCADCGANNNKPEDTHPVVHSANIVYHPSKNQGGATGAYNATGDYKGPGTPREGEWNKEHEAGPKCCRVCAPAAECKNKNKCFNICKEFVAQRALSRLHQDGGNHHAKLRKRRKRNLG